MAPDGCGSLPGVLTKCLRSRLLEPVLLQVLLDRVDMDVAAQYDDLLERGLIKQKQRAWVSIR